MLILNETNIKVNPVPSDVELENMDANVEAAKKGFESALNTTIQDIWNLINQLNGMCTMIDFDYKDEDGSNIKEILESIIDDMTIDIGMIYKAISIVNNDTEALIDTGKEKAAELIDSDSTDSEKSDLEIKSEDAEKSNN